jgi:hypothetical protein
VRTHAAVWSLVAASQCFVRVTPAFLLAVSLLLGAHTAQADEVADVDRNAARNLAGQAKDSFDRGDYETARDLFHRAYALVQAPTISIYEARALVKLGRLVEAEEAYTRTVRTQLDGESSEQFRKAVREAEPELAALQPRIPRLTIVVSGDGARDPSLKVTLDGDRVKSALIGVEMPVNPGRHSLNAQAGAGRVTQQTLTIQEREHQRVELSVARAAPSPLAVSGGAQPSVRRELAPAPALERGASWQLKTALVAGGVGVAGLGMGVLTGVMASSRYRTAERECQAHVCEPGSAGDDAIVSFRTLRAISTVGYVIGGVGAAAGVALFLTAPSSPRASTASLGLYLGSNRAGIAGSF